MIKGYFKHLVTEADTQRCVARMHELPLSIQQYILKYDDINSRFLSIAGKLLLQQLMKTDDLGGTDILKEIRHEPPAKPCFNNGPDFNISHSGDLVVCVVTEDGKVGVDVEQIRATDINAYREYFTVAEWTTINYSDDKNTSFYQMWVRKEALIKAKGDGMLLPLNVIDVCNDKVAVDGEPYYLYDIAVGEGYVGCVCSSKMKDVDVREVIFPLLPGEQR